MRLRFRVGTAIPQLIAAAVIAVGLGLGVGAGSVFSEHGNDGVGERRGRFRESSVDSSEQSSARVVSR